MLKEVIVMKQFNTSTAKYNAMATLALALLLN